MCELKYWLNVQLWTCSTTSTLNRNAKATRPTQVSAIHLQRRRHDIEPPFCQTKTIAEASTRDADNDTNSDRTQRPPTANSTAGTTRPQLGFASNRTANSASSANHG